MSDRDGNRSNPYNPNPEMCCEASVFGRGPHAYRYVGTRPAGEFWRNFGSEWELVYRCPCGDEFLVGMDDDATARAEYAAHPANPAN